MSSDKKYTLDEAHRYFGVENNNKIFAFADKESLTEQDKIDVVGHAFAAYMHWRSFSGHQAVNTQRALYMLAKAYVIVENKAEAADYAAKCLAFTNEHAKEVKDFDWAYCYEINARSAALNGDKKAFEQFNDQMEQAVAAVKDAEDLKWVKLDIASGNWFGFR